MTHKSASDIQSQSRDSKTPYSVVYGPSDTYFTEFEEINESVNQWCTDSSHSAYLITLGSWSMELAAGGYWISNSVFPVIKNSVNYNLMNSVNHWVIHSLILY